MKKTVKIISIIAVSVAALILVADVARRLIPEKKAQPARTEEVKLITEEAQPSDGVCCAMENNTGWLRKSAISPDGKRIAFSYQGDIFVVSSEGGLARQLTSSAAYESDPVWAPDGKQIVFTSSREGSKDIWRIGIGGGTPARITTYQGGETPLCVTPDGKVLFSAVIGIDPKTCAFPGDPQLWSVPLEGGKPQMVFPFTVGNASVNASGDILYEDYKGYEDPLRKHHTSSVTRDIWVRKASDGSFTKLSDYIGEDRNPVFAADGDSFWWTSEREGDCFNIWRSSVSKPSECVKVSSFETHPVRNISASADGTLLASWNGSLYLIKEGAEPRKLSICVNKDNDEHQVVYRNLTSGVSALCPSWKGDELALVLHGDVYVTGVDFKATRRITNTPSQERGVSFAPDGRSLYYAAERDGNWGVWRASLKNKDDKFFSLGGEIEEELFTEAGQTCFQPMVSPDGKWVAFLRDRTELVIRSVDGKQEKSLLKGVNYSYTDGDQEFEWCPDSKHLLVTDQSDGGWNNSDIALVDIKDGKVTNLTRSGYSESNFRWALDGKAMTFCSDRAGYRSHGSWGAEYDVYAMFFDGKAYADFVLDENSDKILKALSGKKDAKKDSTLTLDLKHIEDRLVKLTPSSARLGSYILSPDGRSLYYTARQQDGTSMFKRDLKSGSVKELEKGLRGGFIADQSGKNIYMISGSSIVCMNLSNGQRKNITFSGEFEYRAREEREYIFEHTWKQVDEKFYDKNIHGLDWKAMHDNYVQFLPYIANGEDFKDMLSEMLGELNGSHTGARYYSSGSRNVAYLGVLFDENWTGEGLKIAEVLPGSRLQIVYPELKEGDIITAVNGEKIGCNALWYEVLDRQARKMLTLRIKVAKDSKLAQGVSDALNLDDEIELRLVAGGNDSDAYYTRWVRRNEEIVERLSGGRVGYVHVEGMDSPSFREVYKNALGKYRNCEALIVDTRHNGGGWLHDDLATFLNGKAYVEFRPRGQYIGTEPYSKWNKPSCVLVCEDNYSDASGFPYVYKTLGIGKIIGTPVPGTMTAVWWETQIDGATVFGIPQVTSWGLAEDRPLENLQLEPDILVYNDPQSVIDGVDKQLEAAVAEMLKEIQ